MQKKLAVILSILLVVAIAVAAVFGVQKNDLTSQVEKLTADLTDNQSKVTAATADLEKANSELSAASDKVAALETQVAELTAQVEATQAELSQAKTALEDANTELTAQAEASQAELSQAKAALEDANTELATANEKVTELKAKVEALMPRVINFEDGNYAMLGISTATGDADASVLSVEGYKDGKALRVDVKAKNPYVSINVEGLLGENLEKVRSISFDVGVELGSDGKFYAASGKLYTVTNGGDTKMGYDWSVYLKAKNPKTAKVTLKDVFFTNGQGDTLLITKEADAFIDSDKFPGEEPRDIYLDNIQFLDENGEALPLDTTAVWVNPDTGADLSNLSVLSNAVALEGMNVSAGGWAQAGVSMTEEFRAALVPGSVIEISYESEDGKIWLVFPDSAAGWKRIEQGTATTNNSQDTAQITFTEIAAVLGEDVSTWGDRLQCEGSANWKVYSVKVGTPNAKVSLVNPVEFAGFMCEGGGWAQNGFNFTQEVLDALQPGTALEISFESENDSMWIVLPDSAAGWKRIGNDGAATIIGDKAYITYEQIVEAVGEDKAGWGARLQCEAGSNWKVYAVNVGKVSKMVGIYDKVDFAGFACEAGGWAQAGFEMPAEFVAALKPGAVITISYESENGKIWIVMPDSAAGWMRIGNNDAMNCNGTTAQITFEEIAAVLGEDVSTWGARLQCEGSAAWKVYSVNVGMAQ